MPAEETAFSEIRRRTFVGICTATYDAEPTYAPLTTAPDELATVRSWLCGQDVAERAFVDVGLPVDPRLRTIEDAFTDSDGRSRYREGDAVVVYATGHGVFRHDGGHRLILNSSDPRQLSTTLQTARLVEWLKGTVRHALVVIDTCYAGQALADLGAYGDLPDGWLVLTTAGKTATAGQEVFARALGAYLNELRLAGPHGPVEPYLDATTFVAAIREKMLDTARLLDHGYTRPGPSPCLPNPVYDPAAEARVPTAAARGELALLQSDIDAHWGPRARGVTTAGAPGWFFTGRAAVIRRLVEFVVGPPGLLVVTGRAGCGKSAVLSRLVTFADLRFADEHAVLLASVPPSEVPPPGSVDVAVVATGKRAGEVVQQLAGALGLGRLHWPPDLVQALAARGQIATVVIDAVDESPEPDRLAALVSDLVQTGVVRVVVGIRSPAGEDPEDPAPGPARILAKGWPGREVAAIDREPWWSDADLVAYAREVLVAGDGGSSPYDDDAATAIADRLASLAGRSFLLVRLTASNLARELAPCDPDDPSLADLVDRGVVGVVADDLRQACPDAPDRRRVVDLLVATAFAAGAGLPWHGIWPRVASAVAAARGDPATVYGNADVAELLGSRLGGYLARTLRHDVTVYRPFHESLAEALRSSPGMLEGSDEPAPDAAEVHRLIVAALLPLSQPVRPGISVRTLPRYVRRHLVDHALAAGTLAELLQDADVLLTLRRGAAVLAAGHTVENVPLSALLLRLADLSADHVDERAAVAELRARQLSLPELADRFAQRAAGFSWRATWADWALPVPTLELWRGAAGITAIAAHDVGGSAYVAVGCQDGWLVGHDSVWDPAQPDFQLDLGSAVSAVAIASDDRGPLVAAGTPAGDIVLVRPTQDRLRPVARWRAHAERVSALCFAHGGSEPARLILLSAGKDQRPDDGGEGPYGQVASWNLDPQGDGPAPPLRWETLAFSAAAYSLSVATVGGEPVVFAIGDTLGDPPEWDRTVRLLRLADGTHVGDIGPYGLSEHAAPVPGEPATIVMSDVRGSLHLVTPTGVVDTLDGLETPRAVAVFSRGLGEATAVVATSLGLTVVPLVGQGDAMRFGPARPPLRMTRVTALATATDSGSPIAVVGLEGGRVLVVEADRLLPQAIGPPDPSVPVTDVAHVPVHALAEGPRRRTVVSAPAGGNLRLRDALDGSLLHVSPDKFQVSWMTTTTVRGVRHLLVSAGRRVLLLDQDLAAVADQPLAEGPPSDCAHPFTDGYRDFLVVGGSDESVVVFDIARGIVVARAERRHNADKPFLALATARIGGRTLLFAAGGDCQVIGYQLPEQGLPSAGDPPATLPRLWRGRLRHDRYVRALAVLPGDPSLLASAGDDAYIRLTRLASAGDDAYISLTRPAAWSSLPDIDRPHGGYGVRALAVTGRLLLSGGDDGAVRVWRVDVDGGAPVATVPLDAPVRAMVAVDGTVVVATDLGIAGLRLSYVEVQS
jgi:hypothetical protein